MNIPSYATLSQRIFHIGRLIFTGLILVFLVAPVLVVFPLSFTSGELLVFPVPGWSMKWYQNFFTNPLWTRALRNSLFIGSIVTVVATLLGTLAALGLHYSKFKLKPLVLGILASPLAVPIVIVGVASFYFFARFNLIGTYIGIIIIHTVLALPFVVITVTATLKGFDPNMIRAGASLGASPARAFGTITLPIIAPGVISGALFAFVTSFDEIVVVLFLASPHQQTLPRQIFSGVQDNISPTVTAAAVILLVISMGLMAVMELLRRRGERLRGIS